MQIEIKEIEAEKKKNKALSVIQILIADKTFYKVGQKSHIEENISDYADYFAYCITTIHEEGILHNERPVLMSPIEFEQRQERLSNEDQLKQMLERNGL